MILAKGMRKSLHCRHLQELVGDWALRFCYLHFNMADKLTFS